MSKCIFFNDKLVDVSLGTKMMVFTVQNFEFSKRNCIFPLHSQKVMTYFGQFTSKFLFFDHQRDANWKDWSK